MRSVKDGGERLALAAFVGSRECRITVKAPVTGGVCDCAKTDAHRPLSLRGVHPGDPMAIDETSANIGNLDAGLCECLRNVLDPEIGLNIVDLGLLLDAHRSAHRIMVRLTLTSRACPLGELVLADVREKVAASYPEVTRVDIKLVWDPVWTPDLITDRGYELLGRPRTRTLT